MSDSWSPAQYERYKEERSQPFWDLASLVRMRSGMRMLDLGCGTGELTGELHVALGAKESLGIDNSEAMLARCAELEIPGLTFARGDIAAFGTAGGDIPASGWDV